MSRRTLIIGLVAITIAGLATGLVFFNKDSENKGDVAGGGQGSYSPFKLETIGSDSYASFKDDNWIFSIGSPSAGLEVTASTSGRFNVGNSVASISGPFELYRESASTSFEIHSSGSFGGCLIIKDADGSGSTYCRANDGTLTCNTTSCR